MVRPLSCAEPSTGSVWVLPRSTWMRFPRVVFRRPRLVCGWRVCCLSRALICVRVTSAFWRGQSVVLSVWWRSVYARRVVCRGATLDSWPLLLEAVEHCCCEPGDTFLFAWWMWCVLTQIHWLSFSILQANFVLLASWFVVCLKSNDNILIGRLWRIEWRRFMLEYLWVLFVGDCVRR
jgi:hypothetical protein